MNRFILIVCFINFTYFCVFALGIPIKFYSDVLYLSENCNETNIPLHSPSRSREQFAFIFTPTTLQNVTIQENVNTLCEKGVNYFAVVISSENAYSGIEIAKRVVNCSYFWAPTIFILPKKIYSTEKDIELLNERILRNLSISEFNINSDVYLQFEVADETNSFSLWELYQHGDTKSFEKIQFAPEFFHVLPKSTRRQDFHMFKIAVVALEDLDYKLQVTMEVDEDGNLVFTNGLCVHLLHALQTALNFTYKPVKGEGWVAELPNGTWIGMARQILEDEADISITISSMVAYRLKKLAFLTPVLSTKINAYFRQPQLSSIRDILIGAFSVSMWIALIFIWILISFVFKIFLWVKKEMDCAVEADEEIVKDCAVYSVSVLSQQGWHRTPESIATRIVFLSGTVLSLVSYVALSATLVSNLSTKVIPIKSFDDLAKSQLLVLGDKWAPYSHHFIRDVYTQRKVALLPPEKQFIDIDTGIYDIINSRSAFLTFYDAFMNVFRRNHTDRYFCDTIDTVSVTKTLMPSGMFVKKGSPLRDIQSQVGQKYLHFIHLFLITMMIERGIIRKLNNDYNWQATASCSEAASHFHITLGIRDVSTAYIILISGFLCSSAFIIVELFVFSYRKHSKLS